MIEIKNVTKSYEMGDENVLALDGVNLTVEEGDFLAVTGPSGSGKSTLLFTMGGLLTPTKGAVSIRDTDIYGLHPRERARFRRENVGFIFQTFELLPYLTALENVMLPLSIAGVDSVEQRERALEGLSRVGLAKRVGHKPSQLSGGEQQRVSIARGIVNEPDILLADEPTGNLDRKTGDGIIDLLRGLNERDGQTIVIVTHDTSKAEEANRVINMIDGRVVTSTE
ncbi:putative ABC transporter ATP-binding protein YknY [subsurface metagenome]